VRVQESSTSSSEVVIGVPPSHVDTITLRLASHKPRPLWDTALREAAKSYLS